MLRGVAAVLVFLGHLRGLFFVAYSSVQTPKVPVRLFYFITALGHESVIVFFVLSGLLVGGGALRSIRDGRWVWKDYLLSRAVRLSLVLWPGLLLTACWDHFGIWLFGIKSIYGGYQSLIVPRPVVSCLGWQTLIANALFLQEIIAPTFGSNTPLWSLSYEFWYYIIFPLLVLSVFGKKRQLLYGVLAIAVLCAIGWHIAAYLGIWLMGVAVAKRGNRSRSPWYLSLTLTTILLIASLGISQILKQRLASDMPMDFGVGVATTLFLSVLITDSRAIVPGLYRWIATGVSGMSYTLYVVHLPILIFLRAAIHVPLWQPTWRNALVISAIASIPLLYAFGVSRVTEAKTDRVRRFLHCWLFEWHRELGSRAEGRVVRDP